MDRQFCDCTRDGFCPRFNRQMTGRFREICAGTNVDLGTAAAFREQWMREALGVASSAAKSEVRSSSRSLVLSNTQAPGDLVAMTASIFSLHKMYPKQYTTAVECLYPDVFTHNPYVVSRSSLPPPIHKVAMHYPAIHDSNVRGIHFMQGWCEFLGMALGIYLPLLSNRPRLYFDTPHPKSGDYWLVCSGIKNDFTAKQWLGYQEVVSSLKGIVRFIQVGNAVDNHPKLDGAEYLVGKTTLRQLFDITRKARGVLCGVSLLMHVAAAVRKPAVVIAGGREPVAWNAYPRQQYVHTNGALQCKDIHGRVGEACWRTRTVPLRDGDPHDKDICEHPQNGVPKCMTMISPRMVAELVLVYDRQYSIKEPVCDYSLHR